LAAWCAAVPQMPDAPIQPAIAHGCYLSSNTPPRDRPDTLGCDRRL